MYYCPLYENEFSFPLAEFNAAINFPSVMFSYNARIAKPTETCNKYLIPVLKLKVVIGSSFLYIFVITTEFTE
jgi:hypothetical protein